MRNSRFTEEQIIAILQETEAVASGKVVCWRRGISADTSDRGGATAGSASCADVKGWPVNREEGLAVRRNGRRWRNQASQPVRAILHRPGERCSTDFISDMLSSGERFRCLAVIDESAGNGWLCMPHTRSLASR